MNQCKIFFTILLILFTVSALFSQTITGDLKPWHKVSIDFEGPMTCETAKPNPFTDYRMDVIFTGPNAQVYTVPGFYAADGNAAETSADSGNVWRVNFCPDEIGEWSYSALFVMGDKIAAALEGGTSAGYFDGQSGSFTVTENDNTDRKDFRSKGKLVYVDEHFLQFQGSKEYFIKGGANSPEVFLEYQDFDGTPSTRTYKKHLEDWLEGDPTWQGEKGKAIIGAVNYLSDLGVNVYYFLTMNAYGDGKKAWPWVHQDSITVYDCSKLDQWDIVFDHMTRKGIMPHFVLTETENEAYFELIENGEVGGFADSRKIYYREMIARYGYHPAVTWNIGEENGWSDPSSSKYKAANTDEQRRDTADYLRALTYYNDHISIHNGPSTDDYIFDGLLGHKSMTGPAFQWNWGKQIHGKILEWRNKSADAGHKWVMSMDEAWLSPATGNLDTWRQEMVWGTFMAGGAGIELYIGAGLDISVQNFKTYEKYYRATTMAVDFFNQYIPFWEMEPNDEFTENAWTLQADSTWLLYLKDGGTTMVDLPEGFYNIHWFDPRNGGDLQLGTKWQIVARGPETVGEAPSETEMDWACLITKTDSLYADVESYGSLPQEFELKQNYPNPFNPTTTIEYNLPSAEHVTMNLYNVQGELVKTLVNEKQQAGSHSISLKSAGLASGVYLYDILAGSFMQNKRMLLVK